MVHGPKKSASHSLQPMGYVLSMSWLVGHQNNAPGFPSSSPPNSCSTAGNLKSGGSVQGVAILTEDSDLLVASVDLKSKFCC